MKRARMKAVMAWAIVHADGLLAQPWNVHALFNSKHYARKALKNYGALARVARVRITEVTKVRQ